MNRTDVFFWGWGRFAGSLHWLRSGGGGPSCTPPSKLPENTKPIWLAEQAGNPKLAITDPLPSQLLVALGVWRVEVGARGESRSPHWVAPISCANSGGLGTEAGTGTTQGALLSTSPCLAPGDSWHGPQDHLLPVMVSSVLIELHEISYATLPSMEFFTLKTGIWL